MLAQHVYTALQFLRLQDIYRCQAQLDPPKVKYPIVFQTRAPPKENIGGTVSVAFSSLPQTAHLRFLNKKKSDLDQSGPRP